MQTSTKKDFFFLLHWLSFVCYASEAYGDEKLPRISGGWLIQTGRYAGASGIHL